jgi:hypothetical protein
MRVCVCVCVCVYVSAASDGFVGKQNPRHTDPHLLCLGLVVALDTLVRVTIYLHGASIGLLSSVSTDNLSRARKRTTSVAILLFVQRLDRFDLRVI